MQRFNADLRILDPVADVDTTSGSSLRGINTTKLPVGALCFVAGGAGGFPVGFWRYDPTSTASTSSTVVEPHVGGGRWTFFSSSADPSGETVRSALATTTITDGTVGTDEEVRNDMTGGPPTLRPELTGCKSSLRYRAKGSALFRVLQGSSGAITPTAVTVTVEASVDDFATEVVVGTSVFTPEPTQVETVSGELFVMPRIEVTADFDPASVPGFDEETAADITLRMVATSSITQNFVSADSGGANTSLVLEEIVP